MAVILNPGSLREPALMQSRIRLFPLPPPNGCSAREFVSAQNPDAAPEALHCGVQVHHLIIQV